MSTKTPSALRPYQIAIAVLGVLCAVAIVANLMVRRVPAHDAQIEEDFSTIASEIDNYESNHSALPDNLSALTGLPHATIKRLSQYEYTQTSFDTYQLCATFLGDSNTKNPQTNYIARGEPDPSRHIKGHQCYTYTGNGGDTVEPQNSIK